MNECQCQVPRPRRYKGGSCVVCAKRIDPKYISSDENLAEFYAILADIPDVHAGMLHQAAAREREGRVHYGLAYLGKDNPREASEEVADLVIYCYLHWLRARRDGYDVDMAALVEAVVHGSAAYNALMRLKHGTS
jgi:hypothetical protein